jgi:DNA-binding transcriptional LysR family regulator
MTSPVVNCRLLGTPYKLADFLGGQPVLCEAGLLLTDLVLSGAGVGVRPRWDVHSHLARGQLVEVLPKNKLESWGEIFAVLPSRRFLSGRVRAFLDFLVEEASRWPFNPRRSSGASR